MGNNYQNIRYHTIVLRGYGRVLSCQMDLYVQVLVSLSVLKIVLCLPLITVLTLFYNDKSLDIEFHQNTDKNIPNYDISLNKKHDKNLIAIFKKLENFNENFIKNIDKICTKIFCGILSRFCRNGVYTITYFDKKSDKNIGFDKLN